MYSAIALPVFVSKTRNLCLSTANESNANHWPSGEKALREVSEVPSVVTGCTNAPVDAGRDFGGFTAAFLAFFEMVAMVESERKKY
jgi:hypothetical protein